ncbi:MAG: right-handed parallel beta-helix repeat-containing protein [Ferruginibacter sp.]
MKKLLSVPFLFICFFLQAQQYWITTKKLIGVAAPAQPPINPVDTTGAFNLNGRNYHIAEWGNDANDGLTSQTAWKTIDKLNASWSFIVPGDSILFRSSNIFYGSMVVNKAGTPSKPIILSTYGAGAMPIVTGLKSVTSWTSLGGNIWEAALPGGLSTLNMVVINGVNTPMGRYPNAHIANDGYLSYESYINGPGIGLPGSITDNQLTGSPNWTGGEVIIRQSDFVIKRLPITSHIGTTLSFTGYSALNANYGYFVQNHISTLDENGEWFYDPITHKIKIYYTSTPPSIQAATLTNLVYTRKSNIIFKGIAFKGSEGVMTDIQYCDNITIDNCSFSFAGVDAIDNRNMTNFQVLNSAVTDINMNGIHENNPGTGNGITIQNNSFKRIGINQGMISNNPMYADRQATGINIGSTNLLISGNTFDSTGYAAISILKERNYQVFKQNIISNFCLTLNDGGGIYNSGLRGDSAPLVKLTIQSNILFKSGDASAGTTSSYKHNRAIYLDATSSGVNVLNNTIFNAFEGIYISSAQHNVISGNTVYDVGQFGSGIPPAGCFSTADANNGYQHTRFNRITNNIFFAKYPTQLPFYINDIYGGEDSVGVIDSNYYINPSSGVTNLFVFNFGANNFKYSFSGWRSAYPVYDAHSNITPLVTPTLTPVNVDDYLRFEYNSTSSIKVVSLGSDNYLGVDGTTNYSGSVTIAPYSSIILFRQ